MYTISTKTGLVLTISTNDENGKLKTIFQMVNEASSRLKNLAESGKLLDDSLFTIASFDRRGNPLPRIIIPEWLEPLMGNREKVIASIAGVKVLCEDAAGERLPESQVIIETNCGESFMICSKRKAIIN